MATKPLHLVPDPEQEAQDITLLLRAEIQQRDWNRVWCAKGEPLLNWQRTRRPWRA